MVNPKEVTTVIDRSTYRVALYGIDKDGIFADSHIHVAFCKGNREDELVPRQSGFLTETLLSVCKKYLEENNVGELISEETSLAIIKIQEALSLLDARRKGREDRGVLGTYQK